MAEDNKDSGFQPIESQEELDKIIKQRLDRANRQFKSQNAEIFQKAQQYDELQAAARTDLQKAQDERDDALKRLADYQQREQQREWIDQVSGEYGIPAPVLRGNSLEEIQAHAEALKGLIGKRDASPVVSSDGRRPTQQTGKSAADLFADIINS